MLTNTKRPLSLLALILLAALAWAAIERPYFEQRETVFPPTTTASPEVDGGIRVQQISAVEVTYALNPRLFLPLGIAVVSFVAIIATLVARAL